MKPKKKRARKPRPLWANQYLKKRGFDPDCKVEFGGIEIVTDGNNIEWVTKVRDWLNQYIKWAEHEKKKK